MTFAAGIMLYKLYNGKVWYLLGKENNEWSAFAGGGEAGETFEECANREFYEETCGIFGDRIKCKERVIKDRTYKGKEFYMFMVECPEDIDFTINDRFLKALDTCSNIHMKEKSEIRWVSENEIKKLNLRREFKKQVDEILKQTV